MKTELKKYTVEQICEGFVYNVLEGKGLFGLAGKLTIQPEYQRNYIYADGKKDVSNFTPYTQVFGEKHGFINNLSVLDLLFNEGRFALDYLKEQPL